MENSLLVIFDEYPVLQPMLIGLIFEELSKNPIPILKLYPSQLGVLLPIFRNKYGKTSKIDAIFKCSYM